MAHLKLQEGKKLSIIIPTINEAANLPVLLADLSRCLLDYEIIIVDANSSDKTLLISKIHGIKAQSIKYANRGLQLNEGALIAQGSWLLFLHADIRMTKHWHMGIKDILEKNESDEYAWFFTFKVNKKGLFFRFLELTVFLRSNIF